MKIIATLLGVMLSVSAMAQGAPWYLWKSKVDGKTFCLQHSPGPGWIQVDGPFKDAHCTKRS